ncbi:Phage_Mu_F domain-containing protein [Pseudomonas marincola]|uniref:Phage head morphogenesis domain-containing protein n=1 Tax=Pseudomonas marincola TaxID=437900 RepID=A0A653E812_9PSED|nr:minor capsid protein [Pseudomonas marincola]CAE6906665.1 Phage_Mu_F domain-containing protein [Pseudomonas marincola]
MPTVNERLADAEVSHAVSMQMFSNGVVRRMVSLLNRVDADMQDQIVVAISKMDPATFTVQRLERLLKSVRELNAAAYSALRDDLNTELQSYAEYEAGYQYKLFTSAIPGQVQAVFPIAQVSASQVYAAAMARPFQGKLLSEFTKDMEAARMTRVRDAIRIGFVEGETIDQMVRRIRGTRTNGYADGLLEIDRRGAESIVRTAVNHTSNFARQAFYAANDDLVGEWQFLATLDGRTTITCASLSGKTFPIGSGPQPPRHIGCRSTSTPVIKGWEELGLSPDEIDKGTQASMDGYAAADIDYSDWLRNKPAAFQDDVLGPTRGKLFREGKVNVDRFTNNKGRVYTLDQLKQRDADLFERVGIAA